MKEYICMEQDIHIEDLQESVMQYGRMRSKIEETMEEIRRLKLICGKYEQYAENPMRRRCALIRSTVWRL